MRSDKLQDAIGMVDADLVAAADKKHNVIYKFRWVAVVAAMLIVAIGIGVFSLPEVPMTGEVDSTEAGITAEHTSAYTQATTSQTTALSTTQTTTQTITQSTSKINIDIPTLLSSHAISEAVYPTMAKYPSSDGYNYNSEIYDLWQADRKKQEAYKGAVGNLDGFYKKTIPEFLTDKKNENRVYSPLNVYMAMSMLAEITDNNSRKQILNLLGVNSIEALRTKAQALWNANYCNDGAVTSILGSSLWLDKDVSYKKDTLDNLSKYYYASSYKGEMGSADYNNMFKSWLNEQTDGMLKDQISGLELTPDVILSLATTICFKAKWDVTFNSNKNTQNSFHSSSGEKKCEFMNKTEYYEKYYWGEKFSAAGKKLKESGEMMFILPDEGVSINELLKDDEALSFMTSNGSWANNKDIIINYSIPKFDIQSNIDLKNGIMNLGITDCFNSSVSDFSPLLKNKTAMYVSKVPHGARVSIDEEGVKAAAYTALVFPGSPPPPTDEIDFVLDRPFIFVINSSVGMPLFVGVVNNP